VDNKNNNVQFTLFKKIFLGVDNFSNLMENRNLLKISKI